MRHHSQRAFAIAVRDTTLGHMVARRARAGLLTYLLIPYDALFGRVKDDAARPVAAHDVVRADFRAVAHRLVRYLERRSGSPP